MASSRAAIGLTSLNYNGKSMMASSHHAFFGHIQMKQRSDKVDYSQMVALFPTPQSLVDHAEEEAKGLERTQFYDIARLYFIARYLVSLYEIRVGKLPLQVWNEYRMAFDHFMRHITSADITQDIYTNLVPGGDLAKMRGHLQRAIFDICKFLSLGADEEIERQINRWGMNILTRVKCSDQSFLNKLFSAREQAEKLLLVAKTVDYKDTSQTPESLGSIIKYLNAAFSYREAVDLFHKHRQALEAAYKEHGTEVMRDEVKKLLTD